LAAGLKQAAAEHRRVLLDFGGDWCTDCQVLDLYFHDAGNQPIIASGVPALAILNSKGELLYSQKTGEFEAMRHMQSSDVTEFLNRWKRPGST
jgi:hypothetical protein